MYRRRRSPPPNRYGTTTAPPPSAEYAEPANARCHCGNPVLRNVFPQRSPSCRAFASAPQNGEPSPTADRKASSERPALHRRIRDLRPNAAPGRKKVGIALAGRRPMPPSVEAQGLSPRRQNRRRIPKANAGRETEDRSECRDAPVPPPPEPNRNRSRRRGQRATDNRQRKPLLREYGTGMRNGMETCGARPPRTIRKAAAPVRRPVRRSLADSGRRRDGPPFTPPARNGPTRRHAGRGHGSGRKRI